MKPEPIQPALWIAEGLGSIGPSEALVVGRIAVGGKAAVYEAAFFVREELCCIWVVENEPVCKKGDYDGGETFL